MNFLNQNNRGLKKNYMNLDSFLELRLIFKDIDVEDNLNQNIESIGDKEIDELLDNRALRLILLKEEISNLRLMRGHLEERLGILSTSRESISDLLKGFSEGGEVKNRIDKTNKIIQALEVKIQSDEEHAALQKFKDNFEHELNAILNIKAKLAKKAFEQFIKDQPSYINRMREREDVSVDILDSATRVYKTFENGSVDNAKKEFKELSGKEKTMPVQRFENKKESLKDKANILFESYIGGGISTSDFENQYNELLNNANTLGGKKLELFFKIEKSKYDIKKASQGLNETNYLSKILEGLLGNEIEKLYERDSAGFLEEEGTTLSDALILLFANQVENLMGANKLSFYLPDGPIAKLNKLIDKWQDSEYKANDIINNVETFQSGTLLGFKNHYDSDYENAKNNNSILKGKQSSINHRSLSLEIAISEFTEKKEAEKRLDQLFNNDIENLSETLSDLYKEGATRDSSEKLQYIGAASYSLAEAELVLNSYSPPSQHETYSPEDIDHLFDGYDFLAKGEIPFSEIKSSLENYDLGKAEKISNLVETIGSQYVYFVPREIFDNYFDGEHEFNGEKVDDLRGGKGAYFDGRIVIVYEESEGIDIENIEEVLTHESLHMAFHADEEISSEVIDQLLYKGLGPNEGRNAALANATLGARLIQSFISEKGSSFTDWANDRSEINDSNVTFEDVINFPELSHEIIEELIVMYLTERSINGNNTDYSTPKYFDYLNRFYNTTTGNALLSKFTPASAKFAKGSGVRGFESADSGGGSDEEVEETEIPTTQTLRENLTTFAGEDGAIANAKQYLQDIYNVKRHDLIDQAENLTREYLEDVDDLDSKYGENVPEDERLSLNDNINQLKDRFKENVISKLKKVHDQLNEAPEDQLNFFHRLWVETEFASINDLIKVGQDWWSYLEERKDLRRDRISSKIGTSAAPTDRMSNYFNGLQQSVQNRDISKWKEIYEDKDPQTIDNILKIAKDINQVKALFEIKANTSGDFFFRNKMVMDALERVSRTNIKTYEQAKYIFDELYGRGESDGIERQNESTRSGKISESEQIAEKNSDRLGKLWLEMIEAFESDPPEWIDTAKFEGFITYALKNGKSYLKQVVYILAKGQASGILDYTSMIQLTSGLMIYAPQLEYINKLVIDHESGTKTRIDKHGNPITEMQYIASLELFNYDGSENKSSQGARDWVIYENWLLSDIDKQELTHSRLDKIKSNFDKVDHDYAQDMWWEYSVSSIEALFNNQTGGRQAIQDSGIVNLYGQFITNSLYWDDNDLENKFKVWFKTDSLLMDTNFEKNKDGFDLEADGSRKPRNNKLTWADDKLDNVKGAMFPGISMRKFRNITYFAYKEYIRTGDVNIARDIMVAAALDLGVVWTSEDKARLQYQNMGRDFNNIERYRGQVFSVQDAPLSHTTVYQGASMEQDMQSEGLQYGERIYK